ncbi:MAG: ATP-binding cassette domain-containing protein [Bacteroidetes bacterium]|jgi:ABC-2 type transport system ATP-binding protein|nr:ATP-binding cassette domain-containing protein [Bacteroidota bacterium]
MPAVDIQQVTHRYGDHVALRDVTLTVAPGTLFGLLGPNGGGKTTLFRILSTLLTPSEGTARVQDLDVTARPDAVRRHLGVVFQEPALDESLTVAENLRYHGALYGLHGTTLTARLQHLAGVFGVADRLGDRVQTLSGGLRRRTDLARGLLHRPDVLLLDEPTTGLDPAARHAFWQALARLRQAEGTTLLVATHLMDEAERCDEVGILDRGRLVAHGTPDALKTALGGETLWLETADAATLRDRVAARFDLDVRVIGEAVQISHPEAHDLLPALYDAFGPQIDSATVRRPTLEDVFMVHAGHTFEGRTTSSTPALQPAS